RREAEGSDSSGRPLRSSPALAAGARCRSSISAPLGRRALNAMFVLCRGGVSVAPRMLVPRLPRYATGPGRREAVAGRSAAASGGGDGAAHAVVDVAVVGRRARRGEGGRGGGAGRDAAGGDGRAVLGQQGVVDVVVVAPRDGPADRDLDGRRHDLVVVEGDG